MAGKVIEIDDGNFEELIAVSKVPVMVDFWAPWCGPCKAIGPMLEELSEKYGDQIVFGKCNIDVNQQMPSQCGVKSIPSLVFFDGGEMVERTTGSIGQAAIEDVIKKVLAGENLVTPLTVI